MSVEGEKILNIEIADEMKQSYIDYAMSVIVNRALPDARDGLKPVHRRILFAMQEAGNTPDRPFKKAARTVGDVLGKYHPHGDSAVYDTLVRMAQDFSMRYPLVQGHGNFGSIDGDPAAAMRYTEARLSRLAMELLRDIEKETVDFVPNFDGDYKEPTVLPARFPNLLVNGSAGIAVGMATNIPPHNLNEVIDGVITLIDRPDATLDDLMKVIKGPDFPTGGHIIGYEGIRQAYTTGRGVVTMRARTQIEETKGDRRRIVITEIPYQVNKSKLIERIAELVRDRKIEGITDLRDESDRTGMRIVIEISRGGNPHVVLNNLLKFTQLQQSFGIIMLALVGGRPVILNLKRALEVYLDHQKEIIIRRSQYELNKAEARAHILEGLRIALDHIDRVIALIRASQSAEEARTGLMEQFGLSERQAQAILDMRLQRLVALEREKIEEEYAELLRTIEYLRAVLSSESMVLQIVRQELSEIKDRFGDERRTEILPGEGSFNIEDLIEEEDVVLTLTHQGYIKRAPLDTYRSQNRGGRGVTAAQARGEDFVSQLLMTNTHNWLYFFTDRGLVYRIKVHEVPEAGRAARGTAMINLIPIEQGERVQAVIPIEEFKDDQYLIMATRKGIVKKTLLSEYQNIRKTGLIAIVLADDDELIDVSLCGSEDEILLASKDGLAIRFSSEDVRPMGRATRGVIGMRLERDDVVVGMATFSSQAAEDEDLTLLVVTEHGFGKRTPISGYRLQNRGGKGIKNIRSSRRNGCVVGIRAVRPGHEIMLITAQGVAIRQSVANISRLGRDTQGVTLMRLDEGDALVSVADVVASKEE